LVVISVIITEARKAATKPAFEFKNAAASTFAAIALGSSILSNPLVAGAFETQPIFSSTNVVAEKVVRQGLYNEYEVDIVQEKDDARSTFKSASETKSKKGRRWESIRRSKWMERALRLLQACFRLGCD
jgi:hypothetical protein